MKIRLLLACLVPSLAACTHAPEAAPAGADDDAAAQQAGLFLSAEERANLGLELATAEWLEQAREALVFGRVLHDPAAEARLRAPLAGRLQAARALTLGLEVASGDELFRLEPRWSPQELADLAARRANAAAERAAAEAELPALERAQARAQELNAAERVVSDRELEESEARLRVARARLASAHELEALLAGSAGALSLRAPRAGTLVELLAHEGEEVPAGSELLRLEDFTTALVALELPTAQAELVDAPGARIELDGAAWLAQRVGLAPETSAGGLGPTLLVRVEAAAERLRPGLAVRAWLPRPGDKLRGARVPESALVRLAGGTFVYVSDGELGFARVPIALTTPTAGGWLARELEPGTQLVVHGAQSLLTLELSGRQGAEEED